MALEHSRKKIEADTKRRPYVKKTVIIRANGSTQKITERVSLAELLADDDEEYIDNPEDMGFRREMEGEW